jgi:hypothetical protein
LEAGRWVGDLRGRKVEIRCVSYEDGLMKIYVGCCDAQFGSRRSCLPGSRVKVEIRNNAFDVEIGLGRISQAYGRPESCLAEAIWRIG